MGERDLWSVIGRAKLDEAFLGQLFRNFRQTLTEQGYQLDDREIERAQEVLAQPANQAMMPAMEQQLSMQARIMAERLEFENQMIKTRLKSQLDRMIDLGQYTVSILKNTLGNATHTYRTITTMNQIMFGLGIALFLFAALYAAFSDQKIYSLIFGGLGTVSFITLFLLGPIEKSQGALSNLVQIEISFMNYFEQIGFWETFALTPQGNPPAVVPENIEKASAMLQERSKEIIDLIQRYVESQHRDEPRKDRS